METVLCTKCKKQIELIAPYYRGEEGFIVPTIICPTIESLEKFYEEHTGFSYFKNTDKDTKMEDCFEKGMIDLLHTNPDEDGEDWKEHKLEPVECWSEII